MSAASERLKEIQRTYTNRKTVPWEMLNEMLAWCKAHEAEAEAYWRGRLEQLQDHIKVLEEHREIYSKRVLQLEEQRRWHEKHDGDLNGEQVTIVIDRSLHGWVIADLEEIAYRLRTAGGTDETPVQLTDYSAKAVVPAPNLISLHRAGTRR